MDMQTDRVDQTDRIEQTDRVDGRARVDDPARLAALARSELMDSEPEAVFDRATRLAGRVLDTPVSLLSFVDHDRQFFKATDGKAPGSARSTPLTHSFCQYVVANDDALRITDARKDDLVRNNLAVSDDDVVAYLGVPVHDPDGEPLGSLCAIAHEPREWSEQDLSNLRDIASGVESELRARAALRMVEQQRARTRAVLDELPIGVAVAEAPSAALRWTNRWGLDVLRDEIAANHATDYRGLGAQHPDGSRYKANEYPLVRSAISGESVSNEPMLYRRGDGSVIELEVSSRRITESPGESGQIAVATFVDVTDRKRANALLDASRDRLRRVLEATADPILAAGPDGTIIFANHAAARISRGKELVGKNVWETFPDWVGTPIWQAWGDATRTGKPTTGEVDVPRFGSSYEVRVFPGSDETTAYFRDITAERREAETRQLLVRELNHRVKNLFSIISGMIAMTARATRTPGDMANALRGRIAALARAHDLIRPAVTMEALSEPDVLMQSLVASIIDPHLVHRTDGVSIAGPAVTLSAKAATNLALVLHELATNAAKYGALSVPAGHLEVSWTVDEGALHLDWLESKGPELTGAPDTAGFGTTLIGLSIERQMRGTIEREYAADGFRARMTVPLSQLQS